MSAIIQLENLALPDCVIPVDFQAELNWLLDAYTEGMRWQLNDPTFPRPLVSDPIYQALSTIVYRLGLKRQEINDACHATMLAYAKGNDLEHIGALFNVQRLLITPEDTSVTPAIPAVWETDDRLRLRIQMAIESWTTAGSRGSYEYAVLTASPYVLDVNIDRPKFTRRTWESLGLKDRSGLFILGAEHDARITEPMPGHVAVTTLIDPAANKAQVQATVAAALDEETVIPMTDIPVTMDSETLEYSVTATLYFYPGPSPEPSVKAAVQALHDYTQSRYRLDHDIAVSGLHQAAHQAEVQRVELNIEDDIIVQPWQAAKCTNITVINGGTDV